MGEVYHSASWRLHPAGWFALKSGASITRLPVIDSEGLFARLGETEAGQLLGAFGLRLPTAAELDELHLASLFIAPVTLPDAAMLAEQGIAQGSIDAIDAFRNANMSSRAWAEYHDRAIAARLKAAGWDGSEPVSNAGKHWTTGGGIYGWWQTPKLSPLIQGLSYYHKGSNHRDYATTTHAVFAAGATATPPAPPAPPKGQPPPLVPPPPSRARAAALGVALSIASAAAAYYLIG